MIYCDNASLKRQRSAHRPTEFRLDAAERR